MRTRIGLLLLTIGLAGATMSLGANVYQAVVEVPNWSAAVPDSVGEFRACVRHSHPGYFFQVLVPLTIVSLAGAAIVGWNRPRARNAWLLVALGGVVAAEIFTVAYFFSRNEVLFFEQLERSTPEEIRAAATEWHNAHFLRMAMLVAGVVAGFRSLLLGAAAGGDR
jgi:hypothetical protein